MYPQLGFIYPRSSARIRVQDFFGHVSSRALTTDQFAIRVDPCESVAKSFSGQQPRKTLTMASIDQPATNCRIALARGVTILE